MAFNYGQHFNNPTQVDPIPQKADRIKKNHDGAYVFQLDSWQKLNRFLIIGSEGGTYYANEKGLTLDNAKNVLDCIKEDGKRVVKQIVDISDQARAPKNDPAIFALALACSYGNQETKKAAYAALPKVCRIGTHLFNFMNAVKGMRGSSRGLRNAIKNYYELKDDHRLALDLLKYKGRNGWTHRDIMRLVRWAPKGSRQKILKYCMKDHRDTVLPDVYPPLIIGHHYCKELCEKGNVKKAIQLVKDTKLPRELVPTELYNLKETWEALIPDMPYMALLRNLGKISQIGLLKDFSKWEKIIIDKLTNEEAIKKSRIHPINIMTALYTYRKGKGFKGSLTWDVNARVLGALEDAMEPSFEYIEPMGVNILIALDVSASMNRSSIGTMTAREASVGMAMSLVRSEKDTVVVAFSDKLTELLVNRRTTLNEFLSMTNNLRFRSTNCGLPVAASLQHKMPVDLFVILTDSETNSFYSGHVDTYLAKFRKEINPNAKMVVCGMTATDATIGDPQDPGILNIAGFDSNLPKIISEFVKGFGSNASH